MSRTTVGIDIGTTSVKAVAADGDGRVLARSQVRHALRTPTPSRFEHDPDEAWRRGVGDALDALGDLDDLAVGAVNVTAMVPSLAAFDETGAPLTPGLLYGDERGAHHKTPANDEGELLGFLEWLVAEAPDAASFWPAQAAANHALGGDAVIDTTCAATTTPVWFGTSWNPDVLGPLGVTSEQLPRVAGLGEAAGELRHRPGCVLGAGSIDALCEQLVAGADEPGDVLVILGTTLITWVVTDGWPEVAALWTIPSMTSGHALVGGPSDAGGLFTGWVERLLAPEPEAAPSAAAPEGVPVWLPWPRGERVPSHDRALRAGVVDLDLTHGPAALRRAAHEATAFMVRVIVERVVEATGVSPRRVVATGGGTRVGPWVQALADVTGLPVHVVAVPEGAALGAAWLARMAIGDATDLGGASAWARTGRVVEPDQRWVGPAAERYHRFVARAGFGGGHGT